MKDKLKRALALVLAFAMCLSMGATVFAGSGTQVPSATDARTTFVYGVEKGVTVKAYQILDATYNENGLTGYETAFYTNGSAISIEDLVDITADEVNAIATYIYNGEIEPITSKTLTYAKTGSEISINNIAGESNGTVTLTEEAYYGNLEAGMWIILVEDSNATIYNPMIVSHWYTDANDATSLTTGSVDADGYFYEDIYDYTTDDYGTVTWTSGSYTAVYAKSDTISLDKDIVNYSGASENVTYEEGTTPAYNSNLMTYGLLAEEEAVEDGDDLEDFQETYYEGSESEHPGATEENTDDNADNTEGADYDIGDTVQFEIKTNIPDYASTYFDTTTHEATFMIYDDLYKGLTAISASDLYVNVGGDLATLGTDYYVTLFDSYLYNGTYYYVCTYTDTSSWYTTTTEITVGSVYTMTDDGVLTSTSLPSSAVKTGQRFVISFVESFIAKHGGQGVVIYYATTLNSSAEIVGDTNADSNPNEANLIFSNNPTTVLSTATIGKGDQVYVYTFSITDELVKVFNDNDDAADDTDDDKYDDGENESIQSDSDAGNGDPDDSDTTTLAGSASASGNTVSVTNALAGAEFTIYSDEDCTIPYINQYAIDNGLTKDNESTKLNTSDIVYTTTSDANGYISFYGLSEGTYYITETEAPDGYTINSTVYKVVISAQYNTDAYTGEDDPRDDEVGLLESYTITVTNLTTGTSYTNTYTITNTVVPSSVTLSGYDAERMTLSDLDPDYDSSYFKSLDGTEVVYYSITETGLHQTYTSGNTTDSEYPVYYVEESVTTVAALSEATNGFSYSSYLDGSETIYYCLDADGNRLSYNNNYIYWATSNKDGNTYYIYNSGNTANGTTVNNYAVCNYGQYTYAVPEGAAVYTTISKVSDLGISSLPNGLTGTEQLYYSTNSNSTKYTYNNHYVFYARSSSTGTMYYFYYSADESTWVYCDVDDAYKISATYTTSGNEEYTSNVTTYAYGSKTSLKSSMSSDYTSDSYNLDGTEYLYYSVDEDGNKIKYADNYVYWATDSKGETVYFVYDESESAYSCMSDGDAYLLGVSTALAGDDVAISISTVDDLDITALYMTGDEQLYYLTDTKGNIITYNNNPIYWAISESTGTDEDGNLLTGRVYYFVAGVTIGSDSLVNSLSPSGQVQYACIAASRLWENISSASSSAIALTGEAVSVLRYYIYTDEETGEYILCTEAYADEVLGIATESTGDPAYVTSSSGTSITCYWDDFTAVDSTSLVSNKFTYTLINDTVGGGTLGTINDYWEYFDGTEELFFSLDSSGEPVIYNGEYVYYATDSKGNTYYFYYDSTLGYYVVATASTASTLGIATSSATDIVYVTGDIDDYDFWQYFDGTEELYLSVDDDGDPVKYNSNYVYYATGSDENTYYFYYDTTVGGYIVTTSSKATTLKIATSSTYATDELDDCNYWQYFDGKEDLFFSIKSKGAPYTYNDEYVYYAEGSDGNTYYFCYDSTVGGYVVITAGTASTLGIATSSVPDTDDIDYGTDTFITYWNYITGTETLYMALNSSGEPVTYNGEYVYYATGSNSTTYYFYYDEALEGYGIATTSQATTLGITATSLTAKKVTIYNSDAYDSISNSTVLYMSLDSSGDPATYNDEYVYYATGSDGTTYYLYYDKSVGSYVITGTSTASSLGITNSSSALTSLVNGCNYWQYFDGTEELFYSVDDNGDPITYNSSYVYYATGSDKNTYYFYYDSTLKEYVVLTKANAKALGISTSMYAITGLIDDCNYWQYFSTVATAYCSVDSSGDPIEYNSTSDTTYYVYYAVVNGTTFYFCYSSTVGGYVVITADQASALGIATEAYTDDIDDCSYWNYFGTTEELLISVDSSGDPITYNSSYVYYATGSDGETYYFIYDSTLGGYVVITASTASTLKVATSSTLTAADMNDSNYWQYFDGTETLYYSSDKNNDPITYNGYNVYYAEGSDGNVYYFIYDTTSGGYVIITESQASTLGIAASITGNVVSTETEYKTVNQITNSSVYLRYFKGTETLYYSTASDGSYITCNGEYVYYATNSSGVTYYFIYNTSIEGYEIYASSASYVDDYISLVNSDYITEVTGTAVLNDQNNYTGTIIKYAITATSISISATENPVVIVNTTLIKLPSTGGMGVYLLMAISILVLGAAAIAVTRKKKDKKEEGAKA